VEPYLHFPHKSLCCVAKCIMEKGNFTQFCFLSSHILSGVPSVLIFQVFRLIVCVYFSYCFMSAYPNLPDLISLKVSGKGKAET
jgi:hypothetical protein